MSQALHAGPPGLSVARRVDGTGIRDALHAEWTKLRTVAGSAWLLAGTVVLTVAVSTAAGIVTSQSGDAVVSTGTAGSFQLTFAGQTTNPMIFNDAASDVQTQLQSLPAIGGNVSVAAVGDANWTVRLPAFAVPVGA